MSTPLDYERLEQLLDDLATPLSRWHSARAKLAKQLDKVSLRKLATALDEERDRLSEIHMLIMDYAQQLTPEPDEQELLQQGFDPETMIMEQDGTITR